MYDVYLAIDNFCVNSEARRWLIKISELFEPVARSRKIYVSCPCWEQPRARVIFRVIHASAGCPRISLRLCAMHDAPCWCNRMHTCSRIDHTDSLGQHLREIEWFTSCIATRRHRVFANVTLSHYRIRGRSSRTWKQCILAKQFHIFIMFDKLIFYIYWNLKCANLDVQKIFND